MPLKYNSHDQPQQRTEEFRALWREVDALKKGPAAVSSASGAALDGPSIDGLVKSWSFRLDSNATYNAGSGSQSHADAAIIASPAFTHLDLWLALEKCDLGGVGYLLSVSIFSAIKQFNAAAGADIAWKAPSYDASASGAYFHGHNSLYEFFLSSLVVSKRIEPVARTPWESGDLAFFPITLAGGASGGRLLVSRTVSNPTSSPRSVCVRGYLTGRYIEHPVAPSQAWQCATLTPGA